MLPASVIVFLSSGESVQSFKDFILAFRLTAMEKNMIPNISKTVTEIRRNLYHRFRFLPSATLPAAKQLAYYTFKKTKLTSHIVFIGRCLQKRLIPKGFRIKLHPLRADRDSERLTKITNLCSHDSKLEG